MSTMYSTYRGRNWSTLEAFLITLLVSSFVPLASAYHTNRYFERNPNPKPRPARWGPPEKRSGGLPLVISNLCDSTIWPGIGTQAGTGPGVGGFALPTGTSRSLVVSADWQGRVWGRTNCSFNIAGTGASNLNGYNGAGAACYTGDCGGVLDCVLTGATPVTLAEFDLQGGSGGKQVFYDISLVDGYNIPLGLIFIPGNDPRLQEIPPNLTNAACIATAGWLAPSAPSGTNGNSTNATYPLPWETKENNQIVADWCPWNLQVKQPTKPGSGVYPYPDDNIQRPTFDPCLSACSKTNSPRDCCTGSYNNRAKCTPPLYAAQAKTVCPDAYSYAFDDQTSTFIIPTGGGWEVQFCPPGRSTNILGTFKSQMQALSSAEYVSKAVLDDCSNITIINEAAKSSGDRNRGELGGSLGVGGTTSMGALVVVIAWAVMW